MNNLTKQQLRIIADNNNTSIAAILEKKQALIKKHTIIVKSICIVFILGLGLISLL